MLVSGVGPGPWFSARMKARCVFSARQNASVVVVVVVAVVVVVVVVLVQVVAVVVVVVVGEVVVVVVVVVVVIVLVARPETRQMRFLGPQNASTRPAPSLPMLVSGVGPGPWFSARMKARCVFSARQNAFRPVFVLAVV